MWADAFAEAPLLPHCRVQVLRSGGDLGDEPTRAVASNNAFADSGRIDASAGHKRTVAGAAKKLEGLMEDASKVGGSAAWGGAWVSCEMAGTSKPPI